MAETILHKTRSKKDTQGNLVTEITETRIKNREKKDKFMLLYVEAYSHLTDLPKIANKVLAEILQTMVTGDNVINITAAKRIQICELLEINPQQLSLALKQLCNCNIIQKRQLNQRVFEYVLNPYIFGSGSWAEIKQQRIRFDYSIDMQNSKSSLDVEVSTEYEGSDKIEVKKIDKTLLNNK